MADSKKHELEFFVLRYVPDAIKDEFVNIGVVLLGDGTDASYANVKFTRDWRRVFCLDPGADVEWLQALERDIRMRLQDVGSRSDILYRLQDLCSNVIQISASKACLGEEPAKEIESLARTYLESPALRAGKRTPSGRQRIVAAMRGAFEREGVWELMQKEIVAEAYTYKGDPLKIDCAYRPKKENGQDSDLFKMFHALSLSSSVDSAKALAFSYPQMSAGIGKKENVRTDLTAVVEDGLDMSDEAIVFALAMMERSKIRVEEVSKMPTYATVARLELNG